VALDECGSELFVGEGAGLVLGVDELPDVLSVVPELKKYLSGKIPREVWAYFPATARLTVEMWTPTRSATSCIRSERSAFGPFARKSRWCSKIARAMRSTVLWRCSRASMNQRAFS
jgi:hypothetical protein